MLISRARIRGLFRISSHNLYDTVIARKLTSATLGDLVGIFQNLGEGDVKLELDDTTGVGVVTLDNPAKKNAVSPRMMVRLKECTEELGRWKSGKCVILRGVNGSFCSGGDLESVMRDISTPEQGGMMCDFMQHTLQNFYNLPLLSIAAIEGKALGGGAELATACDFRLMRDDAIIGFVQKKLAVTTGWGGGTRLVQIVGRKHALCLLLSGRLLSPGAAEAILLVDGRLKDDLNAVESCKEWLAERGYLNGHPFVLQAAKKMIASATILPTDESFATERDVFTTLWGSNLHKDALKNRQKHR